MVENVPILVIIDDTNKIYYIEDKAFAANEREKIELAWREYHNLFLQAQINGYKIIKREKNITPMDDGVMTAIDENIDELGETNHSFGSR